MDWNYYELNQESFFIQFISSSFVTEHEENETPKEGYNETNVVYYDLFIVERVPQMIMCVFILSKFTGLPEQTTHFYINLHSICFLFSL